PRRVPGARRAAGRAGRAPGCVDACRARPPHWATRSAGGPRGTRTGPRRGSRGPYGRPRREPLRLLGTHVLLGADHEPAAGHPVIPRAGDGARDTKVNKDRALRGWREHDVVRLDVARAIASSG